MQFKGVNNKERQQYPRSEVSLKRMRISAVCHPCGVGLAVRGVLSASVAESSRHLALPPSLPLFLSTVFQCDGCLFLSLVRGGSWLGCSVVPAMGALFSLGAGCQKWKPLDIPGTQPPLSDAVVKLWWTKKKVFLIESLTKSFLISLGISQNILPLVLSPSCLLKH